MERTCLWLALTELPVSSRVITVGDREALVCAVSHATHTFFPSPFPLGYVSVNTVSQSWLQHFPYQACLPPPLDQGYSVFPRKKCKKSHREPKHGFKIARKSNGSDLIPPDTTEASLDDRMRRARKREYFLRSTLTAHNNVP
ncbi:3'5'cyclic nucleotide phosphodiesterase putative [Anopheles sinensis]|uniref:3'5'cyclic nucleotide phosphodiesterase putative n=1 Tax=Anopheles sinensis TaxID=74873 RepID=A0A084WAR6_ANOSI|nr:3'5'cyclic nucleotide phosphodiesterase putative [Anopheles sinensis]